MSTLNDWIAACAKRYVDRGGLTEEEAYEAARACAEGLEVGEDEVVDPVVWADDDMSTWTEIAE